MKRLGTVLHIVDNLLIVRADKKIEEGILNTSLAVLTKGMKKIGKINELFGPVGNPYVSIKIIKGIELPNLKNERVYLKG